MTLSKFLLKIKLARFVKCIVSLCAAKYPESIIRSMHKPSLALPLLIPFSVFYISRVFTQGTSMFTASRRWYLFWRSLLLYNIQLNLATLFNSHYFLKLYLCYIKDRLMSRVLCYLHISITG